MKRITNSAAALAVAVAATVLPGSGRADVKYWATVLTPADSVGSSLNELGETGWVTAEFTRPDFTGGWMLSRNGAAPIVLPGSATYGSGVSDAGEVLVTDAVSTYVFSGSLGKITCDLGALGVSAAGIDRNGQVVGSRNGHPVLVKSCLATDLPVDGNGDYASTAGHVVGGLTAGGTYRYSAGVTSELPFFAFAGFDDRKHKAVNASGTVAGLYYGSLGDTRLGTWNGSLVDLGTGLPEYPASSYDARGLNSRGDIYGNVYTLPTDAMMPFIRLASTGVSRGIGSLGGNYACVHDGDEKGNLVGHSHLATEPGWDSAGPNFIYTGGKMYDLNTLVPAGTPYLSDYQGKLNGNGQILVNTPSDPVTGIRQAVLLTPLPVTTAAANGTKRADGWFTTNVNVQLSAKDAVTGVREVRYRVDAGAEKVVTGAAAAFSVSTNGAHTVTYRAVDKAGHVESAKTLFFAIDKGGLRVTNTAPIPATVGAALGITLGAAGGTAPYTWTTGSLPAGLSRTGAAISGKLAAAGEYGFTVNVTDKAGKKSSAYLTIVARDPFVITTPALVNVPASGNFVALTASGGTVPFTWSVSALPAGVTAWAAQLYADGSTPAGEYPVTVAVTDDTGASRTQTITLGFYDPISISGPASTVVTAAGTPVNVAFSATGGKAPYTWSFGADAPAPEGLAVDPATGTVSGSVATPGAFTIGVVATDTTGAAAEAYFALLVE